jgi:hypothetical protein
MTLPLTVDKLDAIPEAARGAYVPKDGKFALNVEIEDTSGLKRTNAELKKEKEKLAERVKVLGDRDPADVLADLEFAKHAREKKAKDEGDFEGLKKIQAEELKKKDALIFDLTARTAVDNAINLAGGKVKKLRDVVIRHVKVVDQNGTPTAVVVDAAGKPRIKDGQGTAFSLDDLLAEIKADDDYAPDFAASGASGSGARNGGGGGGNSGPVIIPKNATPAEYRRMKEEAEKAGRPYQVAAS